MGFIFRTIFWLGLALVVVPPQARLGGGAGDVDWKNVDIGLELHNAAYAAWSLGVDAVSTCETNPKLCEAATDLWDTSVSTATGLTAEINERMKQDADAKAMKVAETEHRAAKKIQARVE